MGFLKWSWAAALNAGPNGPLAAYGLVSDPELAAVQAAVAAETPMGALE